MNREVWKGFAGLCAIAMCAVWAGAAVAQTSEIKEKPPMYTYIAEWNIPRAEWADMEKANASDQKILDKAIAEGTIVGYGNDSAVVHQADGATHDDWWSAMSMAGVLNVLDQLEKSGSTGSPSWPVPPATGIAFTSAGITTGTLDRGRVRTPIPRSTD